jgi:hypothetical protein
VACPAKTRWKRAPRFLLDATSAKMAARYTLGRAGVTCTNYREMFASLLHPLDWEAVQAISNSSPSQLFAYLYVSEAAEEIELTLRAMLHRKTQRDWLQKSMEDRDLAALMGRYRGPGDTDR